MNKAKNYSSLDLMYQERCDYQPFGESLDDKIKYSIRGGGASIAAASFGKNTTVIEMTRQSDPIIEINEQDQTIKISSFTRLIEAYQHLTPKGYQLRSVPSHPAATVGGCIAYNAHGQNHERDGCFCKHLLELEIYHPKHGHLTLSEKLNPEIYALTIGGYGITGIILFAVMRIHPIGSNTIEVKRLPFSTMQESYEIFMDNKGKCDFYHALFELNFISQKKQPGYLEMATILSDKDPIDEKITCDGIESLHFSKTINIFGTPLMRFICRAHYFSKLIKQSERMGLFSFMHPSASRMYYFSLFGNRGLIEHQILIPHDQVSDYLQGLIDLLCKYRPVIPLCHTKLFKGEGSYLNFDGSGYCLAFHFPNNNKNRELLKEIDALDIQHNCISNLVKDSRLTQETISQQYQDQLIDFKDAINKYDSSRMFENRIIQDFVFPQ
jgi:decaprenylphospho-beta-D-ribofuranose 2-oxidase